MPIVMKDQLRARRAYGLIADFANENSKGNQKNYKIAMNGLGANIFCLRLSGSLAELQRRGEKGGHQVLDHLARVLNDANLPGLGGGLTRDDLVSSVNDLGTLDYMLVTREFMAQISWFRRAIQAIF